MIKEIAERKNSVNSDDSESNNKVESNKMHSLIFLLFLTISASYPIFFILKKQPLDWPTKEPSYLPRFMYLDSNDIKTLTKYGRTKIYRHDPPLRQFI